MYRIRAITLDLDDTLWAIGPVIQRAEAALWNWLGENYPDIHERFSAADLLEMRRQVMDEFWEQSHDFRFLRKKVIARIATESGYSEAVVEPAFDVFDRARNTVDLYPDVLPGLEKLFERYTIVALTNGNANLQTIGIGHLFHGVVTAVDAGAPKPEPAIFDVAIKETGVSPDQILHVGDHPQTDIEGARQAGLRTAWINRNGDKWPDELEAPDATVATITELRELLAAARS